MSDRPRLILVVSPNVREAAAFKAPPGGYAWDDVLDSTDSVRAVTTRPIVSLPPTSAMPRVEGGGTLWVRDLDQVEAALAGRASWQAIVFEPSDISVLDHIRQNRETLAARGPIPAGASLTADDLMAVSGGSGIGAGFRQRLIGCRVCYELIPGDPITFGVLDLPEGGDTLSAKESNAR